MSVLVIVVFCLTGAAVILSVVNWILLLSLSSKTSELEQEIDKKAQEFDRFKKEKSSSKPTVQVIDTPAVDAIDPVTPDEPIQVMRNVGGSFERAENSVPWSSEYNPSPNETYAASSEIAGFQVYTNEISQTESTPFYSPSQPEIENEVMATISEQPEPENQLPFATFQLYSESAKDADFNNLWKNIHSLLQSNIQTEIGIDFSGINFLYDQELDYLLKIKKIITSTGSKVHFFNCDNELTSLMNKYPELSFHIKKNL